MKETDVILPGEGRTTFKVTLDEKYFLPDKVNPTFQKDKEVVLKCSCLNELVRINRWNGESETYLTIYKYRGSSLSFWDKLKFLFGSSVIGGDVVLSEEEFNKLKEF